MEKTLFSTLSSGHLAAIVVQRGDDQISRDLGGEAVILTLANGKYFGLNEVGARIWQLMAEPISRWVQCSVGGSIHPPSSAR